MIVFHRLRDALERRPLVAYLMALGALLPGCFAAWHFLGGVVCGPSVFLADAVLAVWVPAFVERTALSGTDFLVWSAFGEVGGEVVPAEAAGNQLIIRLDTRALSFAIPFYAALYLATPGRGGLERPSWSLLCLWLLIALGLVATALRDLLQIHGATLLDAPGMPAAEVLALSYQFLSLIAPTLAPVLLWAYGARSSAAFHALVGLQGPKASPPSGPIGD